MADLSAQTRKDAEAKQWHGYGAFQHCVRSDSLLIASLGIGDDMFGIPLWAIKLAGYAIVIGGIWWAISSAISRHDAGVFKEGQAEVQGKWEVDKISRDQAQQKAVQEALAANDLARKNDQKINQDVLRNHENTITQLETRLKSARAAADLVGLRISRSLICTNQPAARGQAASTGQPDATGSDTVDLPLTLATSLRDLASAADKDIGTKDAKIKALQDWITSHGFYTP